MKKPNYQIDSIKNRVADILIANAKKIYLGELPEAINEPAKVMTKLFQDAYKRGREEERKNVIEEIRKQIEPKFKNKCYGYREAESDILKILLPKQGK